MEKKAQKLKNKQFFFSNASMKYANIYKYTVKFQIWYNGNQKWIYFARCYILQLIIQNNKSMQMLWVSWTLIII